MVLFKIIKDGDGPDVEYVEMDRVVHHAGSGPKPIPVGTAVCMTTT